jgi:ribulose-5-phosphate 4-epimerase/fuculose-1-phosphate aldolase
VSENSPTIEETIQELVVANRILANEGVVDALGHMSRRHPERPERYLLSCSRSPALVSEDDIMEFDLDNNPVDPRGRPMYAERPIHGSVYAARPEVHSVCHSHAQPLIPFSVTAAPLRPVWAVAATIGDRVPVWDIRDDFPDDGGMLVVNSQIGGSLARRLGSGRCCLLAGHGAVVAEESIRRVVQIAINLVANAALLAQARLMVSDPNSDVRFLSGPEITEMTELSFSPGPLGRMWEYWAKRASPGLDEPRTAI